MGQFVIWVQFLLGQGCIMLYVVCYYVIYAIDFSARATVLKLERHQGHGCHFNNIH